MCRITFLILLFGLITFANAQTNDLLQIYPPGHQPCPTPNGAELINVPIFNLGEKEGFVAAEIKSQSAYLSTFKSLPPYEINWNKSKLIRIELENTYKVEKLEYSQSLGGVYVNDSQYHIKIELKFHGVCQGVAQPNYLFKSKKQYAFILLPKGVASSNIRYFYCQTGTICPPDIP